jgi:diguanylate cyclase (GGDEF)-like protein
VIIDLDGFKTINDTHGHSAGDRALRRVARLLVACARGSDTVARFGGDEFIVLLEDVADEQHVISIAERLQGAIAEPFRIAGHDLAVSSSMGIVVSTGHEESAESLIRNADAAMYRARPGRRLRDVRRRHAQPGARAGPHRVGPAPGDRGARVQAPVPAPGRPAQRPRRRPQALLRWDHRSAAWSSRPSSVARGGDRDDHEDREWALRQSCLHARAWGARNGSPLRCP